VLVTYSCTSFSRVVLRNGLGYCHNIAMRIRPVVGVVRPEIRVREVELLSWNEAGRFDIEP